MKNDGGPAFPCTELKRAVELGRITETLHSGMSLRDHFAGLAMQAMLSNPSISGHAKSYAKESYEQADAMLLERTKE